MSSRRNVIKNLFKSAAMAGSGGLVWGVGIESAKSAGMALRPPGAESHNEFLKSCIKCGQCVEVCPYDTLKLSTPGDNNFNGTPYFKPREIPCYMCTDYPCTETCPSGALDVNRLKANTELPDINNAKIGLAVIHKETCIAFWGIQCDACYRNCPLMEEAITLKYEVNIQTRKHANAIPVINSESCTGCGICEHVCVVEKSAIKILPLEIATGKVGDHYVKSWDITDEQKLSKKKEVIQEEDSDIESALDYLNEDEDLFD